MTYITTHTQKEAYYNLVLSIVIYTLDWEEKRGSLNSELPTSLAALIHQFREGKACLDLKLNLAKSYKQEACPNHTHSVMET